MVDVAVAAAQELIDAVLIAVQNKGHLPRNYKEDYAYAYISLNQATFGLNSRLIICKVIASLRATLTIVFFCKMSRKCHFDRQSKQKDLKIKRGIYYVKRNIT